MKINYLRATAALLLLVSPVTVALTIEVTRGVERGIAIAVPPFAAPLSADGDLLTRVIGDNLSRSGKFELLNSDDFISRPRDLSAVQYKNWRLLKAEALVIGNVAQLPDGRREIRFRLVDVFREQQLAGRKFVATHNQLRKIAHQISDIIYEQLLGKPGVFDTRIAYVAVRGAARKQKFALRVADADGRNAKTILASPQPILSPEWSPDGRQLAYVSFEKKRSMVYVQDLKSGQRTRIAEYEGINGAPAWSPDGKKLALTLSKSGNPEIYIYELANKKLTRLTRHTAIDTEPAWSPDGKTIAFTSARAGSPQIYLINSDGGDAVRLTREGGYNAGASYAHDGNSIALITNRGNGFRVGVYSFKRRGVRELTETAQDESPAFAPNDEMIVYATQHKGRSILATVSPDGAVQQIIGAADGAVRSPAWSPYNRKL